MDGSASTATAKVNWGEEIPDAPTDRLPDKGAREPPALTMHRELMLMSTGFAILYAVAIGLCCYLAATQRHDR